MVRVSAHGPVSTSKDPASSWPSRWIKRFGGDLILLAVLAFMLASCGNTWDQMPSLSSGTGLDMPTEKNPAPNFTFTMFQGEKKLGATELTLAQLQGKPVVLNFWAGLCPPCRAEMPDLQAFYNQFKDRVTLIGIDLGQFTGLGSQQDAKDLLLELDVTYPAGFTNDANVVRDFKVLGLPTTVFVRADGTIFKKWSGVLNEDALQEQTNALLGE